MKKIIVMTILALLTVTAVQAAEPYGGKHNYIMFSLGGYWPNEELEDEGYKSGGDFDAGYMHTLGGLFGFGLGTHLYGSRSKKTEVDIGDGDFAAAGIEMLFFVQPNSWRIQPYLGLGPAIYYNFLEYGADVDNEKIDETGVGLGLVIKAGARVFLTERFFSGLSLKGFANQWNLDLDQNTDKTYNFGGMVLAFELGFTF